MNIFVLSRDPIEAARMQCDQHVVSQTKEIAQILCTVSRMLRKSRICSCVERLAKTAWEDERKKISRELDRLNDFEEPYKATHINHPVTRWVSSSYHHWVWAGIHGRALADEYSYRFGKTHASSVVIWNMNESGQQPSGSLKYITNTRVISRHSRYLMAMTFSTMAFCLAMPDKYKGRDPVKAYRDFYTGEKSRFARWVNKRPPPAWWPYGSASQNATI